MQRKRPVGKIPNQPIDQLKEELQPGETARQGAKTLTSYRVAALPILDHFIQRLRLDDFLCDHLPSEDRRSRVPTATALVLLLKNLLISREPLYGLGEWASRYVPGLLGLSPDLLTALNDDRVGRSLDRLFDADIRSLTLAVVAHAVREFKVELSELHNDSTTVTFHGDYESAEQERSLRGRIRLAVTHGHNKDHRPDLKQLLYILTIANDGAVPVQFRVESGNTTDDRSHQDTWKLLCELSGRRDFLYVADCKLATAENMAYIHQHGGRFLTVLPRTRGEDAAFRMRVREGRVQWNPIHEKYEEGQHVDTYSIQQPEAATTEGYRLIWYRSARKAQLDAEIRYKRLENAAKALSDLKAKLASPRTRYRDRAKVAQAVETILREAHAESMLEVTIQEQTIENFRQEQRGRPTPQTRYVKSETTRFDLTWKLEYDLLVREALCDGIFPLTTNDPHLSALELLLAYKQQPLIEKRFAQLKTDFVVAPVFLKEVSRIQALLCLYFFVLLVESLLERELRQAMERKGLASIPLYPEGRSCRRPSARRVIDLFEPIQCHELVIEEKREAFTTDLTKLQSKILRLLGIPKAYAN